MSPSAAVHNALAQQLAALDERSTATPADETVANLKAELDTLAGVLRPTAEPDLFENESACGAVTAMVQAIGRDPHELHKANPDSTSNSHGPAPSTELEELPLGTLGIYELLTKLGEGGMGAVYKARHAKLDKIVAIKVLPAERMKDSSAVARFEREMRAVGKLEHPNIVRAMDAGEAGGMHYLVMEYVQGVDLSQLVKRHGPLCVADACELIRQAAVGLDEAHDNGMVHRDIKPSNIMLCAVGKKKPPVVKLLDMGLALLAEAHSVGGEGLTTTGQLMGTLDYMAPEQGGDSKSVDIRADIYALGASLYKLLCGEAIYHGENYQTPVQKLMALATQPAPPIQERCKGVPNELAAVLDRMLEKDPDKRFATPDDVARALAPFCTGAKLAALLNPAAVDKAPAKDNALTGTEPGATQPHVDTSVAIPSSKPARPVVAVSAAPKSSSRGNRPPWLPAVIGGGLLGFGGLGALAAAIVFFLQTPGGTLRVEINDPAIDVHVKGTEIVLTKDDSEKIRLAAGEHALVVTRGDFSFETQNFEIKKGETTTIKVDLLPGKVQVVSSGQVLGQTRLVDTTAALPNGAKHVETPPLPKPGVSNLPPVGQGYPGTFALHIPVKGKAYVEVPTCTASTVADYYLKQKKSMTLEIWVKRDREKTGMGVHEQYLGLDGWGIGSGSGAGYIEGGEVGGRGASPVQFFEAHGPLHNQQDAAVWNHIAAVEEFGKERRLYINGHLVDSAPCEPGAWGAGGGGKWEQTFKLGSRMVGLLGEARVSTVARYDKDFTPEFGLKPDADTLALYHFDEGEGDVLKDSSGNDHHGKIVGAEWVRVAPAVPAAVSTATREPRLPPAGSKPDANVTDSARPDTSRPFLRFDPVTLQKGDGAPLVIPSLMPALETSRPTSVTFEGRVRRRDVVRGDGIVIFGSRYKFCLQNGRPGSAASMYFQNGEKGRHIVASKPAKYPAERWVHLAAVADGTRGEQRFYLDGKLIEPADPIGPFYDSDGFSKFMIGFRFDGDIDWVRVSDTARYTTDFEPSFPREPDDQTLALYTFDEGEGAVLKDSSGNDHHGKIVGAEWVRVAPAVPAAAKDGEVLQP